MHPLHLALALARIPRLFSALFLVPCILSIILIIIQLQVTSFLVREVKQDPAKLKEKLTARKTDSLLRRLILDADGPLGDIEVCRWDGSEEHPCEFSFYDVVVLENDPIHADIERYRMLFNGNFRRLHVCSDCRTSLVIDNRGEKPVTHAHTVWGLFLLGMVEFSSKRIDHYLSILDNFEEINDATGERYLHTEGFRRPVKVDDLAYLLGIIANTAMIVVVALWLAVRAHRKILDYFAHSGALLPLVAATGKRSFYGALWLLTLFRVGIFLVAAVPISVIALEQTVKRPLGSHLFGNDESAILLWLITLVIGLTLAALIASVADLKHRFSLMGLVYRYVPLLITLLGGVVWGITFFLPTPFFQQVRSVVAALPLSGITATLLAPIFVPSDGILATHALLSSILLVLIGRSNVRWFAAHLEEL